MRLPKKIFLPDIFDGDAPSHAEFSNNFACNETQKRNRDKDSLQVDT